MSISETAIIDKNAIIGRNVHIGPYAVIGNCYIGDNCIIHPHAYIGDGIKLESEVEIFNGAVIGREPKGAGSTSRKIQFKKEILIKDNSSIGPHAVIYYEVEIGSSTLIGDGASIREQCRIGDNCIISRYVTFNYNVTVGNRVKIMDLSHITGNTVIEDDVFISALVGTANDNKITVGYGEHVIGQHIKQGAIIGLGANILPQVKIGAEAQVGAAALVTRNVPGSKQVRGVPAKEN
ncbi:hypothetical protein ACQUW5_09515 [Legionella sp. CNM-1927-20]|uniref:hypothetical protein n=1 Tax=Legionella sp. CNM-1927-20 TaxID=3422221 RepID=UPI00403B27AA